MERGKEIEKWREREREREGERKGRGRERGGVDTVASYLHDLSPACQVLIEGARKREHTCVYT